jgi:pimeloyl-ACP methyl ester carboxylesterase
MEPLFGDLDSVAEFVAIDAPSTADGDFGWWHGDVARWKEEFRGWKRTRDSLLDVIAHRGPFDGVFGFSQGAALTGVLPGLLATEGKQPLDFAIMAGGFRSLEPEHDVLFAEDAAYRIPSLHLAGRSDTIVPLADSLVLARQFTAPTVLEHPGGHVIGATASIRQKVAGFLREMADRAPGQGND